MAAAVPNQLSKLLNIHKTYCANSAYQYVINNYKSGQRELHTLSTNNKWQNYVSACGKKGYWDRVNPWSVKA